MPEKKLFLLDAMALIYRAHFAFIKAPRITSKGLNTSAAFGFTNTVLEVLNKEKPTHIGVAFDTAAPTFRHVQFEAYKAQREAQPEDITIAIPYCIKLIKALNIPCLLLDGFEADDVIGTVAKKAAKEDFEVFMMTPDKDYGQLVEEHIYMYKPAFLGKGVDVLGIPEVLAKWQIKRIDQVIDILGLMGDSVDNIPGIPGVGEKTAQKLIEEYDSIENLIVNAGAIKGKLGEKVAQYAEQALLCKHLATIDINVPIEFNFDDLKVSPPNKELITSLFDELEFRTLKKRVLGDDDLAPEFKIKSPAASRAPANQLDIFGASTPVSAEKTGQDILQSNGAPFTAESENADEPEATFVPRKTIDNTLHHYHLADTSETRKSLAAYLSLQDAFCFDTETTSVNALEAELVGLSFSYVEREAFYVPVPPRQRISRSDPRRK